MNSDWAVISNQLECAKLLLKYACNANITNSVGERAYDIAVKFGRTQLGMAIESSTNEEGDKVLKGDRSIEIAAEDIGELQQSEKLDDELKELVSSGLTEEEKLKAMSQDKKRNEGKNMENDDSEDNESAENSDLEEIIDEKVAHIHKNKDQHSGDLDKKEEDPRKAELKPN